MRFSKEESGQDRREFLTWAGVCASQWVVLSTFGPRVALAEGPRKVAAEEPWARIEELDEGIWAVVSTPLAARDFTTICNGGIIAGDDRVLVVESFGSPAGAKWVADQTEKLTGRRPTDIVITHFHGDHANGIEGFHSDIGGKNTEISNTRQPRIWRTAKTLELIEQTDSERKVEASQIRKEMLDSGPTLHKSEIITIDLGGRSVKIHPRVGHTPSDVTVEIESPAISFCGDLVWNGFFPNYRDTLPSEFSKSLRALRRDSSTLYVSGHGPISDLATVDLLIEITDNIGEFSQRAHAKGTPVADAAKAYKLPDSAESWVLFSPNYFEVAIGAWYKELG